LIELSEEEGGQNKDKIQNALNKIASQIACHAIEQLRSGDNITVMIVLIQSNNILWNPKEVEELASNKITNNTNNNNTSNNTSSNGQLKPTYSRPVSSSSSTSSTTIGITANGPSMYANNARLPGTVSNLNFLYYLI